MKKIILPSVLFLLSVSMSFGQSGQKWATGGNQNSSGDFLGTTNAQPVVFKTNAQTRATFGTSGGFQLNHLIGSDTRMVQTDANGNLIFPFQK